MIDLNALIDSAPQRYNIVITLLKANSVLSRHRKCAVSVSGGSDSDIIMDLMELVKPDYCEIKYVFFDTGLEYEATKRHLGEVEQRYGVSIDRRKPRKTIPVACREHGIQASHTAGTRKTYGKCQNISARSVWNTGLKIR